MYVLAERNELRACVCGDCVRSVFAHFVAVCEMFEFEFLNLADGYVGMVMGSIGVCSYVL